MSNFRFSPRQMKFLELYLGGALMKDAAKAAVYQGASGQARYWVCLTVENMWGAR